VLEQKHLARRVARIAETNAVWNLRHQVSLHASMNDGIFSVDPNAEIGARYGILFDRLASDNSALDDRRIANREDV
jgi:hypothetical protein